MIKKTIFLMIFLSFSNIFSQNDLIEENSEIIISKKEEKNWTCPFCGGENPPNYIICKHCYRDKWR